MWKIRFFVLLAVFSVSVPSSAVGQPEINQGQLMLHITGFENGNGVAKVALVNSKQNYTASMPFKGFEYGIVDQSVQKTIMIPYGEYALKIYHDENQNDKMDKHMLGMPTESYGFSNNARGRFGPPAWEDVRFVVDSPAKEITINLN